MQIKEKSVVVTGGANGLGGSSASGSPKGRSLIAVPDVDEDNGKVLVGEVKKGRGEFFACDVSKEEQVKFLVDSVTSATGEMDIFCSNAGIAGSGGPEASDRDGRSWEINMMAHVYAARAVLPQMLKRKEGYLLQTVSAAGLLTCWIGALFGHQACGTGLCRMAGDHLW